MTEEDLQYRSTEEACCSSAIFNMLDGRWYCQVAEAEMAERRRCVGLLDEISDDGVTYMDVHDVSLLREAIVKNLTRGELERRLKGNAR